MAERTRVFIADARTIVRAGVRAVLAGEADLEVAGEAADGREADRACREMQPDVLIVQFYLPGLPTAELVARLRESCPAMKTVALADGDDLLLGRLAGAGLAGCVLLTEPGAHLVRAVRAVACGKVWFSEAQLGFQGGGGIPGLETLDKREVQLLSLLARGRSSPEITAATGLAERTVRYHLGKLYAKLGLRKRAQVIAWAARHGLDEGDGEKY